MPPQRKRKSESAPIAEESGSPAAKRVAVPETPATGEKRKRGRPRKYPEGSTPKRPDGPKRGRGRPRKDPNAPTPSKPTTPKEGRRPIGRPRKTPTQNGTNSTPSKTKTETADAEASDERSYWLMKAEPDSRMEKGVDVKFSIDDLRARKEPEPWDGVRNPVAQKHMREMKKGDFAFFYHSNCKVPGIAGIMEIVQEHSPDESAFDPAHPYYDEKSNRDEPKWQVVHVQFQRKFKSLVTLNELKSHASAGGPLESLQVLKQSRLSVTPVNATEWAYIMGLAEGNELQAEAAEASNDESAGGDEPGSSE
ncbi:AT DNA binding protein [Aspergillus sclerotiicarbonarius CBS 121057]|uniref:Thymocyte nuclear protein 1 n=1 Tax=Aspergillus sclerotiicarbonarius (strain CBS 121057 / IBT 28362) TaxID=1448318 RepID=A0A319E3T4_ASPSB|nr:AT DNA binding protein [Aspergillus sclerotiicarbonarius CBS 121057]